jgi:hypothetical protein
MKSILLFGTKGLVGQAVLQQAHPDGSGLPPAALLRIFRSDEWSEHT